MQLTRRYAVLTLFLALLGGVIAAVTAIGYFIDPASFRDSSLTICIAGLGAAAAAYFLSIHQLVKKNHPKASAMVMGALLGSTILLVIAATGGIDSPYYALWLLGIVIAGLFGGITTLVVVAATTAIYGYEFYMHHAESGYILTHAGQLAISLVTAGVSEWIHLALGRSSVQHEQVVALSGQLNEEALKSNVLMESVSEGVMVVNNQHQIQLFNPAAVQMTGWDADSAQNIDYRLVLSLHDAAGTKLSDTADPFAELWKSGKSLVHTDLTMQTKAGRSIAISLSLSPIFDPQHNVTGGIALFRDISAEKEIERQRNEFISTASHEMRTPVAAVEGYLSLVMNPAVATIDDRAKGYLEKAHTSTQHLGALFRDLLSITKMEDSTRTDKYEVFDLTQLVKEAVSDMQFTAQKKNLEVQFGTSDVSVRSQHAVLPIYAVRGNPQRMREVINNLMENAIKFTQEGSIRVTIGGTNDNVTVGVTDTGIGIAGEDIPHLFQKFYRIDSTATRTIGGTGLGLYLCRTIIELLGGRIWVESKAGEGSTFKFTLPRQPSDTIAANNPTVAPAAAPAVPTTGSVTQPTAPTPAAPTPLPAPAPTPIPVTVAAAHVSAPAAPRLTTTDIRRPVATS